MKTEARKGKEAGCAPVRKEHKTGDARGRPSGRSSFLGDPGAKFFCRKRGNGANREETRQKRTKRSVRFWPTCNRHRSRACKTRKLCEVF